MAIKVTIDREECIICGACWATCPEVFEESPEDNFSQVIEKYRTGGNNAEGQVGDELRKCVTDAAEGCPVSIIHVSG